MLIIFNKSGNEFNVDFQYDSFSQSDSNVHIVDVIVDDTAFSNYDYNGYVQFLREGEKQPSDKFIMTTKRFERNGNYYNGYTFKMQSDWFTAIAGTLKMTIEIKKFSNGALQSNKAYGVVNIPINASVSAQAEVETSITDAEYNAFVELINSKFNKDDYDIDKTWFDSEDDFANDIMSQVVREPSKRKIFFTRIGDEPIRYEAIGLVYQRYGDYYCNVYSADGINRYMREGIYAIKVTFSADDVTLNKLMVYNKASVPAPTEDRDAVNRKYLTDNFYDKKYIEDELEDYIKLSGLDSAKLIAIIGKATQQLDGIMSKEDKQHLDTLVALMQNDNNSLVDTLTEVLKVFNNYPQGVNLFELLSNKADKTDLKNIPYEDIVDKPEEAVFVVRSNVSEGTTRTAQEIEINGIKWAVGVSNVKLYQHCIKSVLIVDSGAASLEKRFLSTSSTPVTAQEFVNALNNKINSVSFSSISLNFDNGTVIHDNNYGAHNIIVYDAGNYEDVGNNDFVQHFTKNSFVGEFKVGEVDAGSISSESFTDEVKEVSAEIYL